MEVTDKPKDPFNETNIDTLIHSMQDFYLCPLEARIYQQQREKEKFERILYGQD